ncbi:MAG: hypothetical protein Q7R52_03080 [archaeon]|nr:hypothetical protein [archaeon]
MIKKEERKFEYLKDVTERSLKILKKLKRNIYWVIGIIIVFETIKAIILWHFVCR